MRRKIATRKVRVVQRRAMIGMWTSMKTAETPVVQNGAVTRTITLNAT